MHQTMLKSRGQPEVRNKELEMKAEIAAELMDRKCDSGEDRGMDGWTEGWSEENNFETDCVRCNIVPNINVWRIIWTDDEINTA